MYSEDGRNDLLQDDEERRAATELVEMEASEFVRVCCAQQHQRQQAPLSSSDRGGAESGGNESKTGESFYHYFTSRLPNPACFNGATPVDWSALVMDDFDEKEKEKKEDGHGEGDAADDHRMRGSGGWQNSRRSHSAFFKGARREDLGFPSIWLGGCGSSTQVSQRVFQV
jgi:hypothetical protein